MELLKVRSKNFLSYGENFVEFVINKHQTTMLVGLNGMGKSTIIDSITFALYGKSFRDIKKDLLINNVNKKGTVVELELIGIHGKKCLIRRGLKPHFFEIYEDDKLVNQHAEVKDYQEYLEKNIIGMNFITFSQTVIISKTRYTPFMKLRTGERRSFVESILNIEIFGDMLKLQAKKMASLKEEETSIKNDTNILSVALSSKVENLKTCISLVENAKLNSENEIKHELGLIDEKIEIFEKDIKDLKSEIDTNDYSEYFSKDEKLKRFLSIAESKIVSLNNDLKKANESKDECHVCGNPMDPRHRMDHINSIVASINDTHEKVNKIKIEIEKLAPKIEEYKNISDKNIRLKSEIQSLVMNVSRLKDERLRISNKKIDTSEYDSKIHSLKQDIILIKKRLEDKSNDLSNKLKEINTNTFVHSLLKDSGIKSAIIQNSIPIINKTINDYLHKFGFFITFELDSEFNEKIYVRGINTMVYSSFSEGEKLRIDLALILAWRELSLMQSGLSCNLLFFDEMTDSSMDSEGVDLFIKAINNLHNTNTWIITHTPEKLENYVRGFIEIDKVDGFSYIKK